MIKATVYSFMTSVEEGKVIKIERDAENVSIPPSTTSIGQHSCVFGSIKSLNLENTNIIIIEKYAFSYCQNLEEITFPPSLEEICEGAFFYCKRIRHISFPYDSKLRIIGERAFFGCIKLDNFDFPPPLEFIGKFSFYCRNFDLRKTKIKIVEKQSARRNSDITIYFPLTASLSSILNNFQLIIEIDESHPVVKRDGCGYNIANRTIFQGKKDSRHVLIRRSVEKIGKFCFCESKLVSVTIPSSVITISKYAFSYCESLQIVRFSKNSQLKKIGRLAFYCCPIAKIQFPNSLKIIKSNAFFSCLLLREIYFSHDSELERIEDAFLSTRIKHLSLPSSVKEIENVCNGMFKLESIHVSNEFYESNFEGTAIFSKDGSELVCVINSLRKFEIPDDVRVIKKGAFNDSLISKLIIPQSVEVIEESVFQSFHSPIEFSAGSRLKSLGFDSLPILRRLVINGENFITKENGVVMSLNPRGIVFVPRGLTELELDSDVEVIYSYAFYELRIKCLTLPKSLKKIFACVFAFSFVEDVTFEEGTKLDFIDRKAFDWANIRYFKFPHINEEHNFIVSLGSTEIIEFPPNFSFKQGQITFSHDCKKIICPRSSLLALAKCNNVNGEILEIIEDQ